MKVRVDMLGDEGSEGRDEVEMISTLHTCMGLLMNKQRRKTQ